jgi:hypothetical protein
MPGANSSNASKWYNFRTMITGRGGAAAAASAAEEEAEEEAEEGVRFLPLTAG